MVAVEPAVVGVPAGGGAAGGDFRVGGFRHYRLRGCLCCCGHGKSVFEFECEGNRMFCCNWTSRGFFLLMEEKTA